MRNKSIEARFVSFEGNILNFLYEDTLISLIPNAIYIDGIYIIFIYKNSVFKILIILN